MTYKPVSPSDAASGLSTECAQRIVAEAGRRYFESRRSRVDGFVDHHFSLAGSAAIHRKAVGWDMLKAPANIALAVPQLATKLAAAGAKARERHTETSGHAHFPTLTVVFCVP